MTKNFALNGTVDDAMNEFLTPNEKINLLRVKQLMDSFLNLTSDGIVVVDLEGKVLEINKQFEKLHGWSRAEIIGKVLPMTPLEMQAEVFQLYQRIINGEQFTGQESIKLRKDGSTFYADVTISPIKDEYGKVIAFVGVERDITQKKKAEEALKESEERYRILVESLPEPVVVYTDFRISFLNQAAAKLIGSESPDQLIGEPVTRFVHPQYVPVLQEQVQQLLQEGGASDLIEKKLIRLDGEIIDVEVRAVPVTFQEKHAVQLLFRDVTDRKLAELKLIERERQYRRLLKLSPEPIVLHSDGFIHFVNDAAIRLLGGEGKGDLTGRSFFDFFLVEDYLSITARLNEIVQTDECNGFMEIKLKRLDRVILDVEMSSIYVHKHMGSPVIQTVIRDMTERKRTEEYIRTSEKLSVIGQLAAGVAHEIRNPLTSLIGFVQLLKSKNTDYTNIMLEELGRINCIVNEFMAIAKPGNVTYMATDPQSLTANVVQFMQPQALLYDVHLRLEADVDMKAIRCEPNQIKQVMMNILKNAIESMPNGGAVVISLREGQNGRALIRIEDQGCGIPEDKLTRLGEPFFSMKENGTGLGLMVCKQIIEAHKGKMTIQSKLNEGTIVEIELP